MGVLGVRGRAGRTLTQPFELPKDKYEIPKGRFMVAPGSSGIVSAPAELEMHVDADLARHNGSSADDDSPQGIHHRCVLTKGRWCGPYLRQERIASKPVPRGAKECPNVCSGWGNCNYDTGVCECPAGRGGPDCGEAAMRPCTNRHRGHDDMNVKEPKSHMGPDHSDLDVEEEGWTASRCYGYCDDKYALCFCGEGKYRHIPAPEGSPPWTPPVQWGRPLTDACQPHTNKEGRETWVEYEHVTYETVYGPEGWCNKEDSKFFCACFYDGNGHPCDGSKMFEPTCFNQCSGHGRCHLGFCRCDEGWYGQDCSRKKAGLPVEKGFLEVEGHALSYLRRTALLPQASLESPALATRARPLIYVYDMPPEYTSRMLQYRGLSNVCVYRLNDEFGSSHSITNTYGIEHYLHEAFLQSEHRTFDPEEADFFYVPMYISCYMWPVLGWADYPWYHAPYTQHRPLHGANMVLDAKRWLQEKHPWWDRRGGRDHIWLMSHDEGACWMPTEVYNTSIVLTHWGRMDLEHWSGSAYVFDNYSLGIPEAFDGWPGVEHYPGIINGHPCYDPKKDLVIPAFKPPSHYANSPLIGQLPYERDILFYFRGDVGQGRWKHYSRGIRQKLFWLANTNKWHEKYNITIGAGGMIQGDYSEHLARSKFCLVAPGDGWSPRAEDAILHGCVPVVIMDNVHAVFESILDWDGFSIRVKESAVEHLPKILAAITPDKLAHMQRRLARVWHRFAYASGPLMERELTEHTRESLRARHRHGRGQPSPDSTFQPVLAFPTKDDAFHTILQWLYHRIEGTR